MPRPPILPTIDWTSVFDRGLEYAEWIEQGERLDNSAVMKEIHTAQVIPETAQVLLEGLSRPVHIIAIAENWCGDVVRHTPVLQKLCDQSEQLRIRYITREGFEAVFARYVTNGGEAIPKFVFLNDQFVECGNWGPMPWALRVLIARGKASGKGGEARQLVSAAYAADSERLETVRELMDLIEIASAEAP
jgi:hypothetical protein